MDITNLAKDNINIDLPVVILANKMTDKFAKKGHCTMKYFNLLN